MVSQPFDSKVRAIALAIVDVGIENSAGSERAEDGVSISCPVGASSFTNASQAAKGTRKVSPSDHTSLNNRHTLNRERIQHSSHNLRRP